MLFYPMKELFRKEFWVMTWAMSAADFKMRDQGTFLGFLWTLLHPLIYFLVLYGLFSKWMGSHIPEFPVYLIIGFVQWSFFSSGTSGSIFTIMRYGAFIKSINFPKTVLVFASVLSVLFSHLLELGVLLIFLLIVKGAIVWKVIGLLPLLLLNVYLVVAFSFILATVGVYFLDMSRIWGILMSIGIFLTPIFYSLDMLNPWQRNIILLNPMTHIIKASREILIDNRFPADYTGLAYVFVLSTVVLVFGYQLFKTFEGYFVEKIQ